MSQLTSANKVSLMRLYCILRFVSDTSGGGNEQRLEGVKTMVCTRHCDLRVTGVPGCDPCPSVNFTPPARHWTLVRPTSVRLDMIVRPVNPTGVVYRFGDLSFTLGL
ncbi:hypothetical protein J6590_020833 [Homalodisca vitripennis]|nr:hypothetical protein J6590_020833 [Homalodisca vitripennis]